MTEQQKQKDMTTSQTNIKQHANGVITYTLDNKWIKIPEKGWGNGYISIPVEHPFAKKVLSNYNSSHPIYSYVNDEYPIDGQEWTYSEFNDMDGVLCLVLGFDTLHSWNTQLNSAEEIVVSLIESYVSVVNSINH